MEKVVTDILNALREGGDLDAAALDRIVRARSKQMHDGRRVFAKKRILPFYLQARAEAGDLWRSWNVDEDLDRRFVKSLQMKPRRTASGVATITVITKPWGCKNSCVYCPNDPRMPKSYLSDEPACQRAERCQFHPYLQIASRLRTLSAMGHATDKVEVIVLGGTWLDYPAEYRTWFVCELFRALNASEKERERALQSIDESTATGEQVKLPHDGTSRAIDENGALPSPEGKIDGRPASLDILASLQSANEAAEHRMVGLVMETRPDTVTCASLTELRALGCTKVQLGVQSIDACILKTNGRRETPESISGALNLARLFGFKTHAHFMLNLLGTTPESDMRDYAQFVTNPCYLPDEVKLYPCALVAGTKLVDCYRDGSWRPYTEEELLDVLCADMRATPAFTRVSRMIRDISAKDILVGNKKTNLRQLVDEKLVRDGSTVEEIRFREIGTEQVDLSELELSDVRYETVATVEHFLQWTTPEGRIAGFLRLSLPRPEALARYADELPVKAGEAMIREVHVYGFATRIDSEGVSAQHRGLGRALVERACEIARDAGYGAVNVISAVGTRGYYRKLGFADNGLYQQRSL